tara:strand:+ start:245 stop:811 length:567 start_codon:yes stop_codon:yes gene_type:complete
MSKRLQRLIERARSIIEEQEHFYEEYSPSYEIQVFDFDSTLHHEYSPLPCLQAFQEHLDINPVYIVTAREPGQEQHISDVLAEWGIGFDTQFIFAVGKNPKGPVVRELVQRHQAEKCTFWDDKIENCESVFENCCDIVDDLQIFHLSRAVPGDIRLEIGKSPDCDRYETKHSLLERKLFRQWRKLGKI